MAWSSFNWLEIRLRTVGLIRTMIRVLADNDDPNTAQRRARPPRPGARRSRRLVLARLARRRGPLGRGRTGGLSPVDVVVRSVVRVGTGHARRLNDARVVQRNQRRQGWLVRARLLPCSNSRNGLAVSRR